ncbi:MAG: hypothetical protein ACLGPL_05955 [Acidobacteriota bacterium]
MNREEQIKVEASRTWMEIDKLIMKVKAEQQAANRELDELGFRLPKLLVSMAMGHVTREEVGALKSRMAELRETIGDAPIILRELEKEKRLRCFNPLQDACFVSKERGKYNELKERMMEEAEGARIDELRRCARDIGEEEDCERFLACLTTITSQGKC